ncbi:MAG TPA: hypothetical protein VKS44_00805 [Candidatus Acidoferrales bacterium]|nr:hypothetical protein [Candidatus Acidoferrales bacterium]
MRPKRWIRTTEINYSNPETPAIRLGHCDPADAFSVVTAKVFDLTRITADSRLLGVKGISVLANS